MCAVPAGPCLFENGNLKGRGCQKLHLRGEILMIRLRWIFGWTVAVAVLSLAFTTVASAAPISLAIGMDANEGGFGFSYLHDASTNCSSIGVVEFCEGGSPLQDLTGTLSADLTGNVLSGISGTIVVAGGPDIIVTGGFVNFDASSADTFGAELVTSTHGTFYFLDHIFAGAANSFNGVDLRLWGNNWNNQGTGLPGGGNSRWGIDLGITAIPEPGTALLLGLGLAMLANRRHEA